MVSGKIGTRRVVVRPTLVAFIVALLKTRTEVSTLVVTPTRPLMTV